MEYIVLFNPTLRIIGPFHTTGEACEWGRKWEEGVGDNPCWNIIVLEGEPVAELRISVERP